MDKSSERFKKLCGILKENSIDEYDFIQLKSEDFLLETTKLAINVSIVKEFVVFLSKKFMLQIKNGKTENSNAENISDVSLCLLLFIPDHCTAWNQRKELILSSDLFLCKEFSFTSLVFSKHPKSCEAFQHRKWLIKYALSTCQATQKLLTKNLQTSNSHTPRNESQHTFCDSCLKCTLLSKDLNLSLSTASKYPNNYLSWNHRIWSLQTLSCFPSQILLEDLASTNNYIHKNISDYTAYNHKQNLLLMMMLRNCDGEKDGDTEEETLDTRKQALLNKKICDIILEEWHGVDDLMYFYHSKYQSMYYHNTKLTLALETFSTTVENVLLLSFVPLCLIPIVIYFIEILRRFLISLMLLILEKNCDEDKFGNEEYEKINQHIFKNLQFGTKKYIKKFKKLREVFMKVDEIYLRELRGVIYEEIQKHKISEKKLIFNFNNSKILEGTINDEVENMRFDDSWAGVLKRQHQTFLQRLLNIL